ncbi:MAG: hypothetical protein H6555_08820 [Lewinellaceae bacterium]|nr:hypothetical protein [Lewinellaceae bacterium]
MNRIIVIILLFMSITACRPDEEMPVPIPSEPVTLTVEGGYGSGAYMPGDTVHLWAQNRPAARFTNWSGPTVSLPQEWHAILVMPAKDLIVTANYEAVVPWAFTSQVISGVLHPKPVFYYFPPSMRGVIFLFHGTGGQGASWTNRTEMLAFCREAAQAGFGLIATDCEERTIGDQNGDGKIRWKTTPVNTDPNLNIDIANIATLRDYFISRGDFSQNMPLYAMGMSNGGAFSISVATALNFKAAVSYCADGIAALFGETRVPVAFRMAAADQQPEVSNEEARDNAATLARRGICTDYLENPPSPLFPERFARIDGISEEMSKQLFTELSGNQALDARKYVRMNEMELAGQLQATPTRWPVMLSLTAAQRGAVADQLSIARADHQFYSDFTQATLGFLRELCR